MSEPSVFVASCCQGRKRMAMIESWRQKRGRICSTAGSRPPDVQCCENSITPDFRSELWMSLQGHGFQLMWERRTDVKCLEPYMRSQRYSFQLVGICWGS